MSTDLDEFIIYFNIQGLDHFVYIMHSGHSCGAMSIAARDTGLITPGKKNIYNPKHMTKSL